ncbi:hypothetical protein niasHT_002563 [Heterodera trifolii]|uniref:Transposase n=1 Tax=Heterodera trifolii TaxID=157864 RepID=A0ABD2LU14_9BILA
MDNIRYYAIVIRYWHGETKTGILEVCSETSEKALDMEVLLMSVLDRCGLPLAHFVSLCADNTTANFGGRERRGQNNLFHFLSQKKTNLVGIGCSSHICNNAIGYAVEKCDYDVRNFSRTIADHFSNHPGRWELFQEMAAEENVIIFGVEIEEMDALFGEIAELKQTLKELQDDRDRFLLIRCPIAREANKWEEKAIDWKADDHGI